MKTSQFIGAAVLSILGVATGAQAETYQGVQTIHSLNSRAEVASQARAAARAGDAFSDASYSGVTPALNSTLSRASVRAEAAEAARQGDIYGDAETYRFPAPTVGKAGRTSARNAS
ncbi:MAG: alpha/beta hydrolase [Comamonadaceae bacterium]|nr:MAG: alpha/beta hydrolase [Comamonadaceae bacterium]